MSWFGWGSSKPAEEDHEVKEVTAEAPVDDGEEVISTASIQTEAPSIAELLTKHKEAIAELRDVCKDVLQPEHDDIWLLRYILSRKTVDKAEPAVRKGIEWRAANKEWLAKAKEEGGKAPYSDQIERFTAVDIHKRNRDGGAVMIIRAGLTPVKQLMEVATVPQLTDWFMFLKEKTFLICDEATRRTGKLVKTVVLNDATGVPGMWELMGLMRNNGLMTALGDSSKLSESVYPQLVSVSVILNPPGFVRVVFKIARVFMSASMMEKVKLCGGHTSGDITSCPYAAKLIPLENIPTFLGGKDDDYSDILDPERKANTLPEEQTPDKGADGKTPKSKSSKKKKGKK